MVAVLVERPLALTVCEQAVSIKEHFSAYPRELEPSIQKVCRRAPDILKKVDDRVEVKLLLPTDVVPIRSSWRSVWCDYVLKEDLDKLPITIEGLKTTSIEGQTAVMVSELAKRHIVMGRPDVKALWNPRKETITLSTKLFQGLGKEQDRVDILTAYLVFELGNASINRFYRDLARTRPSKTDYVERVEQREREVAKEVGDTLQKMRIPNQFNHFRFTFPWRLYQLAMEVTGHIEITSRLYNQTFHVSLPHPESKWEYPVLRADRPMLQALIFRIGCVIYGDTREKERGQRELRDLETSLTGNVRENWEWFKRLCKEEGLI